MEEKPQEEVVKKPKEKVLSVYSWDPITDDFVAIGTLGVEDRVKGPSRVATREECEVRFYCHFN